MSPILSSFGGAIERIFACENCQKHRVSLENFVSLNFQPLGVKDTQQIRNLFEQEKYAAGLVYEGDAKGGVASKPSFLGKLLLRKETKIPILTLRDFFCHLNMTKSDSL